MDCDSKVVGYVLKLNLGDLRTAQTQQNKTLFKSVSLFLAKKFGIDGTVPFRAAGRGVCVGGAQRKGGIPATPLWLKFQR